MTINTLMNYPVFGDPPDPRIQFWRFQEKWPQDAGGYVFAARAVLRLGAHLYPNDWTEKTATTPLIRELPPVLDYSTSASEVRRGIRILRSFDSAYRRRCPSTEHHFLVSFEYPSSSEWAEAVQKIKRIMGF